MEIGNTKRGGNTVVSGNVFHNASAVNGYAIAINYGSGVTNGTALAFYGTTGGNDTFTGGNGNDSFLFAAGGLTALDTVVGGGGNDTLWMTTAGTTATAALVNVTGIEGVFLQAGGTFNLANGITGAASFAAVGSSAVDTFDASLVTGYKVAFTGNGGADVLKGGTLDDTFFIADSAFATINGNAGIDRITLTAASQSFNLTANAAKITNLEVIDLNSSLNSTLTLAGTDIALVMQAAPACTSSATSTTPSTRATAIPRSLPASSTTPWRPAAPFLSTNTAAARCCSSTARSLR